MGGRGVGHWEPPSLPLQKKQNKTLLLLMTLISSDSRILFPNTVLSEEVMSPPPQKKIHFSIPQFSFVIEFYACVTVFHFCSVSLAAGQMWREEGLFCCFFLSFFPQHPQQILTWRHSWNPAATGWILADVNTGIATAFPMNLGLWSSESS